MRRLTPRQIRRFALHQAQDVSQGIWQDAIDLADALEFRHITRAEARQQFDELKQQLEEAKCE